MKRVLLGSFFLLLGCLCFVGVMWEAAAYWIMAFLLGASLASLIVYALYEITTFNLQYTDNMKLSELIDNREKLRKYDQLKEWRGRLDVPHPDGIKSGGYGRGYLYTSGIPAYIKQVLLSAIDAEIEKLDKE